MAKRRKGTNGKAGRRAPARRKGSRPAGKRTRGRTTSARHARPSQAAHEVTARRRPAAAERPSALRLADPPLVEEGTGRSEAADREAAALARRIEATVGGAEDALRAGPAAAAEQLRIHREQMEDAARRREAARELPGAAALGLELAVGALKLVGSLATAPLRLGLALLGRGDATAERV